MTDPAVIQVRPLPEVRQRLSGILARFRREGAAAEPVASGSHREPEAILLPYEAYERYEALLRQRDCRVRSARTMTGKSLHTWTGRSARPSRTAGRSRATGSRNAGGPVQ